MRSLATLAMGPRANGRGYQLLADSGLPPISAQARDMLDSLPLSLAGWADSGEAAFDACVPLTEGAAPVLLMRGRFIGEGGGGSIAFANAVVVEETLAPLELLALQAEIPEPDGAHGFAETHFIPASSGATAPAHYNWGGLGLAWVDRLLLVPSSLDRRECLASALASIAPAEQSPRVRGWATTAALRASGSFVPARSFQLIATDRAPPPLPHLVARVTETGFEGERIGAPLVWTVWRHAQTIAQNGVAWPAWQPDYAGRAADALIAETLATAIGGSDASIAADLCARFMASGEQVLATAAADWLRHAIEETAIDRAAALAIAPGSAAIGDPIAILMARGDVQHLSPAALAPLLLRHPEEARRVLALAPRPHSRALAAQLIEADSWSPGHARLAAVLVATLAEEQDDEEASAYFAAGIGRLMDWSTLADVRATLLRASVAAAMGRVSGAVAARYAATLLRLRDAVAGADPAQFSIANAAAIVLRMRSAHG